MHLRTALVASVYFGCAIPALAQHCSKEGPANAATSLYRRNYSFIHSGAESPPLSPALQKLIVENIKNNLAQGDVGPIDWDFWTDSQDGEAGSKVSSELISKSRMEALVRLRYQYTASPTAKPSAKFTDVHLVKGVTGCWLVDNLVHNNQDLRKLLSQYPSADGSGK